MKRTGRPPKYPHGRKHIKVYYDKSDEIYMKLLDMIAQREGMTRSDLVLHIIKEYVQYHLGGNPEILLPEFKKDVNGLEAELVKEEIRMLLNRRVVDDFTRTLFIKDAMKVIPEARKALARTNDPELRDLLRKLLEKVRGGPLKQAKLG